MGVWTIEAGACGRTTRVRPGDRGRDGVELSVESNCPSVQKMAEGLGRVAMEDVLGGFGRGKVFAAAGCLPHAACPVPSGIMKAAEAALGLNLPRPASIEPGGEED